MVHSPLLRFPGHSYEGLYVSTQFGVILAAGSGETGQSASRRPLGEINAPAAAGRYSGYEPEAGGIATAAENDMNAPKDAWISELFKQVRLFIVTKKQSMKSTKNDDNCFMKKNSKIKSNICFNICTKKITLGRIKHLLQ